MKPVCFVNASLASGADSLRVVGDRIVAIGVRPASGDRVVDMGGDRLLPGLINAHDHLQFSNFPRTRYRETHENASEWIADVTAMRRQDAGLVAAERLDFESRLFAGGVKNLLGGATTVAHHDAFHASLGSAAFPVRVVEQYGWSHSPALTPPQDLVDSFEATPPGWPWIVHAGEGIDGVAAAELEQLASLRCLDARTLLVHALAFDTAQVQRLVRSGAGVIWCPSSNLYLFGCTLDPLPLIAARRLALGSDSRISGARDLLEELETARHAAPGCAELLENLVTAGNAALLRLEDRGALRVGALADFVALPAGRALAGTRRKELRMVMVGGEMRYGDADYAAMLAESRCVSVRVDGAEKVLAGAVVERLASTAWREPGLETGQREWRAA
ncbi:MAG TPA: amidohydrolase family protein [Steroidobacteraceae bacterium]|jgi:cytosine/adenosine deaminase-related metal-dependent hydrolase|nr:amidohydrolase family protein [Steroidobacteraceae bacterium]